MSVTLVPVNSSAITMIGYDPDNRALHVVWSSGDEYVYSGVSQDEYDALKGAESIGSYFARNIRPSHEGRRA